MKIVIYETTTVNDIQQRFCIAFPFLSIRFCNQPHGIGEESKTTHWYKGEMRLCELAEKPIDNILSVEPTSTTGEVEQAFESVFGLHVQVFRKEGERWVQTAGTDSLTLDEQNEIGRVAAEERQGTGWSDRLKRL